MISVLFNKASRRETFTILIPFTINDNFLNKIFHRMHSMHIFLEILHYTTSIPIQFMMFLKFILSLIIILNMKKLQNYLMKPEELRKKLQNPRFRQDFIEWSKSNTSINKQNQSRHSRSKSPVENIQRSVQLNPKRMAFNNKENMRSQSGQKSPLQVKSTTKTPLTSKNHNNDKNNRNDQPIKRNPSNSFLSKPSQERETRTAYESLNNKTRYNSCSLINYQKRERSKSHFTSAVAEEAKQKRIIKQRYSYRTRQGVQINNPNKVNQDSLLIKTNLADRSTNLYAIADGHGVFGHLVSQFIVKNMSKIYEAEIKNTALPESIPRVFEKIQKNLTESDINASCSGSTLVNVLIDGDEVICANVGDSRAILARQIDRKSWELIYLSQDHKPSTESQKRRILKAGGRVHAFKDENGMPIGPLRVWLPNQNMQGLAMSRSFGDNVSKAVGVSCQPQIIRMKLDKRDKFILLASDGVWQFISNQEVLQLIVPYYKEGKLEQACDALGKLAYERWTSEDNSVVDDITFVLIFLFE